MLTRRHLLLSASAALAAAALVRPAHAQGAPYPAKPIQVKVAFASGGPSDTSIRAAVVLVQRALGQPVVAENMPGAGGSIAAMNVAKAAGDGYTLLGTTGADFLVAPFMVASAKYKPSDFRLLGVTGLSDFILVSSAKHDFKSIEELIAHAKNPAHAPLSIAHWGVGSAAHLVAADFQQRAGVQFLEVPYKGVAPSMTDMVGGQIDLAFVPLGGGPTVGMIQTGKIKALGMAGRSRNPAFPNIPLVSEAKGLAGFEHNLWVGILAPAQTPDAVVQRWTDAMNEWIVSPENKARMAANAGGRVDPMTPAQADAFLRSEGEKFSRLARALKLTAQ